METYIRKDHRKRWKATTTIPLWDNVEMHISTYKTEASGLITYVSVGKNEGTFFSHMMYQDFSRPAAHNSSVRCTAKNVELQHMKVLDNKDFWISAVKQHYGKE